MNSCIEKQDCICKKYNSIPKEFVSELEIRDSRKSIKLSLKNSENTIAVILDDCLITKDIRCDALFLFEGTKKISFLVELKGFGEIEKAFKQLSYTKQREEYKKIVECFKGLDDKKVYQKCFIITNGKLDNSKKEKFENKYKIRVVQVLVSDAIKPIPDLRKYL